MTRTQPTTIPGLKIAAQMSPESTEDDFAFVNQMGIDYAVVWTDASKASAAYYKVTKERFAEHNITVYGFGNGSVHNQDAITLGLDNRDDKIEEYKRHLRNLGEAGVPYTTYAHMADGVWSTVRETTRGGASARAFNWDQVKAGNYEGVRFNMPLPHGRIYAEDEIWENYTYFIKQVAPVAEEAGVFIGIHPDDPPVPELGGVARCIFSSFEGYKQAIEIADSPNVGLCLCVGCWLEGGEMMGKGTLETIQYFGEQNKIFKVHFRNVNAPLPHFVETFVDDGYQDMYPVMKALREVDFNGVIIPDHIPTMANDHRVGTAFSIGYMKALVARANEEVGT